MLTLNQTRKSHIFNMVGMSATGAKGDAPNKDVTYTIRYSCSWSDGSSDSQTEGIPELYLAAEASWVNGEYKITE